nr:immunoglobulin light chain junction region [Macaca mulatta]MOX72089.1 immunoglobulin light chain junction region [Macaca mulatta]MOX72260.1 immunoglobulin light chain junction region [Macaca mulatta]MOX73282.1 immunoglobulin light chain junction region [Macaca mulatta]
DYYCCAGDVTSRVF